MYIVNDDDPLKRNEKAIEFNLKMTVIFRERLKSSFEDIFT